MYTSFLGQWAQKLQAIKFRGIKKTLMYLINGSFFDFSNFLHGAFEIQLFLDLNEPPKRIV